ncbi:MAG: L,D-transpeptidase family protein [Bacteroidetes bacterium]|nr:L,D-transpeptidase family protein [Bacteroidota bacterium]
MKHTLILITLLIAGALFWVYGRSVWYPLYSKIKGKETVDSINRKYGKKARKSLSSALSEQGFNELPSKIMLLAFKEERRMDLLAQKEGEWFKLKSYDFTAFSGKLGPKLKEGDKQIPEGIYEIEYLNPNSAFHLSMKVSYPNDFDRQKAQQDNRTNPGGDIFIHGKDVTIGCIPIGDKMIEELFILASQTLDQGIRVVICPWDFRVNPEFPVIESVDWEGELYEMLMKELGKYPN